MRLLGARQLAGMYHMCDIHSSRDYRKYHICYICLRNSSPENGEVGLSMRARLVMLVRLGEPGLDVLDARLIGGMAA